MVAPMIVLAALLLGLPQDTPTDIPKSELPKSAVCAVCEANGEGSKAEKVAAGVKYKGKAYYFCNNAEIVEFKTEPDAFLPPVLPRPAPKITWKGLTGEDVKVADLKGKPALLDFWSTTCVPCVKAMPEVQKLHGKYAEKGLQVVGVSLDPEGAKKVRPFVEKRKFSYRFVTDTDNDWKRFNVRMIPTMMLLDKDGQIVQQWSGKVDMKEVEKAVTGVMETAK